ncbi:sigma-54 dependent transcriptional regulator [Desulfoluna sp.]|uniref:sigma-54-dependent transcriptional regulator n=1 Tax=Desulfoluna sp. TaxID=2045199 RepID=UPI002606289D|nr:sigma-54 dependent transcriptional regulator [Desulfoluna sp.]
MTGTLLLIDDDESLLAVTSHNLTTGGFSVIEARSGEEGLALFRKEWMDLVVTDVKLSGMDGLAVLSAVKEINPDVPVIVITAHGSIELAVDAMKHGAFTFLTKPFSRDALRLSCRKALEMGSLQRKNRQLIDEIETMRGHEAPVVASDAMKQLVSTAVRVAKSEAPVLITGESGTGKEVVARMIHRESSRSRGPLITVNCAAIPENLVESELFGHVKGAFTGAVQDQPGKFRAADGGTLFLDEIGDLPLSIQAKLLRAIQEKEVEPVGSQKVISCDIRLLSATHKDLPVAIRDGSFREDLFYRIGVVPLQIPPLRDRPDEISVLAHHFLSTFALRAGRTLSFSQDAIRALSAHPWPGNIRELKNVVERCAILAVGERIDTPDLALVGAAGDAQARAFRLPREGLSLPALEQDLIRQALDRSGGNRSQAARLLGVPRHVLIYRLEKYGMTA